MSGGFIPVISGIASLAGTLAPMMSKKEKAPSIIPPPPLPPPLAPPSNISANSADQVVREETEKSRSQRRRLESQKRSINSLLITDSNKKNLLGE